MKRFYIVVALICLATIDRVHAQSEADWGDDVLGSQLSITMTNSVVSAGDTNLNIQCAIKNSSTNTILLTHPLMLPDDTHLFLIDESGKALELTPNRIIGSRIAGPTIQAGETNVWVKPFAVSANVEPGRYKLKATRLIRSQNGTNYQAGKLVSNLLNVQVK